MNYNNCKLINIVWIERGILLTLIHYIIKFYDKLLNKTVIVNIHNYRKILRILFPEIKFKKFKKHKKNNFYFNIRNIIKKQDIIIDYIANYNTIPTKKINLVPWYDMNDILIAYQYNDSNNIDCSDYSIFIKEFSKCRRSMYNNMIWDVYSELKILKNYSIFMSTTINNVFDTINRFVKRNYTDTVINNVTHHTYYVPYKDISYGNTLQNMNIHQNMNTSQNNISHNNIHQNMNTTQNNNIMKDMTIPIKDIENKNTLKKISLENTPMQSIIKDQDTGMDELIIMINGMINNINNIII